MKLFLVIALGLVLSFSALELLGFREYTGFLSGTLIRRWDLGVLYGLSWFGVVIVAPIFSLAALVAFLLDRVRGSSARCRSS